MILVYLLSPYPTFQQKNIEWDFIYRMNITPFCEVVKHKFLTPKISVLALNLLSKFPFFFIDIVNINLYIKALILALDRQRIEEN